MSLRPQLLLHPNLPMPLHGLNPRTLKGQAWWDEIRQESYKRAGYCCEACGVPKAQAKYHQWLECHENYEIDYKRGIMTIKEFVALCHACHNFIHNGRLFKLYEAGSIGSAFFGSILAHGSEVLFTAKLPINVFALTVAELSGVEKIRLQNHAKSFGTSPAPHSAVKWADWRMVLDGVEYPPIHATEQAHQDFYRGKL